MKIYWLSDGPQCGTGYSSQSLHLLNYLADKGWTVHYQSHTEAGLPTQPGTKLEDGTELKFTNHRAGSQPYCQDILESRLKELKPDAFGVLLDLFMLYPWALNKDFSPAKTFFWFPSDGGFGLPSNCENVLRKFDHPVAMSKYAQRQVKELYGIDASYIPHATDPDVFKPLPEEERQALKKKWGLQDRFVIGVVARNQSRKMLERTLFAFNTAKNYIPNAVLLIHCLAGETPIIIRKNNVIDIIPIRDVAEWSRNGGDEIVNLENLEVLSDGKFIKTIYAQRQIRKTNFKRIITHSTFLDSTPNHKLLNENNEDIFTEHARIGTKLKTSELPASKELFQLDPELAWTIGFFVAEGTCGKYHEDHRFYYQWRICNTDKNFLIKAKKSIELFFNCKTTIFESEDKKYSKGRIYYLITDKKQLLYEWFDTCYTKSNHGRKQKREKKVPAIIFNAQKEAKKMFLEGYIAGDGHVGKSFISIKTNSQTLAQGIFYLFSEVFPEKIPLIHSEERDASHSYYQITFCTQKKDKERNSVKKIVNMRPNGYYVYDIHTENGMFNAGIGNQVIHNSDPADPASVFDMRWMVNRLGLQNRVVWSGTSWSRPFPYNKMNEVYNLMDTFFLSTSGEGFGIPLIEAMSAEIPILANNYTTTTELVTDHDAGEAVRLNDEIMGSWHVLRGIMDVEDAADRLIRLALDENLRRKYGKNGRKAVIENYSWNKIGEEWLKTLSS